MKLDAQSLTYIKNVVETAQMVGIDNVIIEPGKVRAINDEKSVVLFQEENVPDMPFNSVGLNRIGVFLSRLEVARTQDSFAVDVKTDDNGDFVTVFGSTRIGFQGVATSTWMINLPIASNFTTSNIGLYGTGVWGVGATNPQMIKIHADITNDKAKFTMVAPAAIEDRSFWSFMYRIT